MSRKTRQISNFQVQYFQLVKSFRDENYSTSNKTVLIGYK